MMKIPATNKKPEFGNVPSIEEQRIWSKKRVPFL